MNSHWLQPAAGNQRSFLHDSLLAIFYDLLFLYVIYKSLGYLCQLPLFKTNKEKSKNKNQTKNLLEKESFKAPNQKQKINNRPPQLFYILLSKFNPYLHILIYLSKPSDEACN